MFSYKIKFITLNDTIAFQINSLNKIKIEVFIHDLLSIFIVQIKDGTRILNSLQNYSFAIKNAMNEFINKYNKNLPQLNAVNAFLRKLEEDEAFFFLPNIEVGIAEIIKINSYLRSIKEGGSYEQSTDKSLELFGELITKYDFGIIGDKRISIGEKQKNKRVCRFCQNKSKSTTFENKAHAISEALGNKTVVLLEECDNCNKKFSETIEGDIIQYLGLYRTMFKVKGKGGNKKFEGRNFNLKNEEQLVLSLNSINDRPKENGEDYNLKLEVGQEIILQNIYKSLCKYFLSVIDSKYLPHFQKTIDWINGNIMIEKLPLIAEMNSYYSFSVQPKLEYYLRKIDNKKIPYAVGQFYFTCKIFAFIIPFADTDNIDFTVQSDFDVFWKTFKHFDKSKGWTFNNYSNNNAREFGINLNFKRKNEKDTI